MPEKLPHERSFNEIIAREVEDQKFSYASSLMARFRDGDPAAIKMVQEAIREQKYQQDGQFPLNDNQYKQIIQLAARRLSGEFVVTEGANG